MKVRILIAIGLFLFPAVISAQIWPGDANDDGIVNHIDLLYLGYAYDETGPERLEMGFEWQEYAAGPAWGETFPGTTLDISYADCDGDGTVTFLDRLILESHYGEEQDIVSPVEVEDGVAGQDVELSLLIDNTFPFMDDQVVSFVMNLGTEDMPVNDFQGIAFTLNYDPEVFEQGFIIGFSDIWTEEEPNSSEYSIIQYDYTAGKIEMAITRGDQDPLSNTYGPLGLVTFVIIDDVVGIMEPDLETSFYVDNIIMVDSDFGTTPVVPDTTSVIITNNDVVASQNPVLEKAINVFPNPTNDLLKIESTINLEQIDLYNSLGNRVEQIIPSSSNLVTLNRKNYAAGIYWLKIHTSDGILTKKVIFF